MLGLEESNRSTPPGSNANHTFFVLMISCTDEKLWSCNSRSKATLFLSQQNTAFFIKLPNVITANHCDSSPNEKRQTLLIETA
jgi:hypothetical protein